MRVLASALRFAAARTPVERPPQAVTPIDPNGPMSVDTSSLDTLTGRFRSQVTDELASLDAVSREQLRGDYVFVIDGVPRFLVVLGRGRALSGSLSAQADAFLLEVPEAPPAANVWVKVADALAAARAAVHTDAATLGRLLSGTMKAKSAFLAGRVRIEGDLPGFLRLIGLLKARGVKAPGEFVEHGSS